MPKQLIVQFTPIRSCLVNLPGQWVSALLDQRKLPQNVILEISWSTTKDSSNQKKTYCGWSGEAAKPLPPNAVFTYGQNSKLEVLEMDPQVGQAVGLVEGQKINVEFCRNIPDCASVHVEPYTEDDWEILELHAGYVEENLLGQIRAVYNNQLMCVWIHGRTLVRLRVAELDPKVPVIKLNTNSEVIVAPKVRKQPKAAAEVAANLTRQQKAAPHTFLRNLPVGVLLSTNDAPVLIHPDSIGQVKGSELVCISKVSPGFIRQKGNSSGDDNNNKDTVSNTDGQGENNTSNDAIHRAKEIYAPVVLSTTIPRNHVCVDQSIRHTLDIKDFDIVKIATVTMKSSPLGSIILRQQVSPAAANQSSLRLGLEASAQQAKQKAEKQAALIESFKDYLDKSPNDKIVLTQGTIFTSTSEQQVHSSSSIIQFGQKKGLFSGLSGNPPPPNETISEYITLTKSQIKNLQVEVGEDIVTFGMDDTTSKDNNKSNTDEPPVLGGINKLYEKIHQYTVANVADKDLKQALSVPGCGGILITGAHGAGKSSLVKKLIHSLHCDPRALIYTREVNCAEIAEERVPTFKDLLQQWFDEAAWHAPSLLFFDDIDRLIPAEVEHADSTRSRHLAELFLHTAHKMTKRHQVMIIATSQQQQSLHPALIGNHVFTELRHLNPPSRDERKEIMETIMANGPEILQRSLPNIDFVAVASETEGYLAADLKALIERTVHEGAIRSIKEKTNQSIEDQAIVEEKELEDKKAELQITQDDFTKAREDFVPSSLRGVKLQSSGVLWSDIGGLNETRKTLLETLEWPTKYSVVFQQCPLRLRSGLLLYGFPGCGKTLLASAVAKECGLNFISVKGPEILNKYIGASEKSVRDLFERASAAKPCVLFFDEFDSIAPRRGHDSTGVTDRVVNQMLTQMDGAEGLDGVYVLAATSRPDLIDPALLRPGRLDKSLLCGMPSFEERLEILEALSRKMTLSPEVDLKIYSEKTEGFSGADLQGFLYNAHLEAIHGAINIESFKEQQKKAEEGKQQNEEKSDFVMVRPSTNTPKNNEESSNSNSNSSGQTKTKAPLTLAEKGQISQRLALIKKGVSKSQQGQKKKTEGKSKEEEAAAAAAAAHAAAAITPRHLEKSLKETRPSITAEEYLRLSMIYNEFVTGRTGELPSGEGAKGIGKRTTLG